MQTENSTENQAYLMANLAQASRNMADALERAAALPPAERGEPLRLVLVILREMRGAVMAIGRDDGMILLFTPDPNDANVCEICGKTWIAHDGEESKCP